MITGIVNPRREALVRLEVLGTASQKELEAIIDTGFTGSLTLPSELLESLGLSWLGRQQGMLADGSVRLFDVYAVTVRWDGQVRVVEAEAVEGPPLLGMGLLDGYELRIQIVDGDRVTIQALS